MALTFGGLLYFQIMYLENMVKMRKAQFTESVKRSLYATAGYLEKQETLHFLESDASIIESSIYDEYAVTNRPLEGGKALEYSIESPDGTVTIYSVGAKDNESCSPVAFSAPLESVAERYKSIQDVIRGQYLYQKGLLNEVILTILSEAGSRPVMERADSTMIRSHLSTELANNGVTLPFEFSIADPNGATLYSSPSEYVHEKDSFSQILFANTSAPYIIWLNFPSQHSYIFSSVRFIIPTLALTVILLVIFIYIICLAFRQKKLTEMKTDFINNMTHELKTPISTISLAAQMLNDESVRKSPTMLNHVAKAITEESKRLRFQVEKVLQMSMFDNAQFSFRMSDIDANGVITNVVNNFKIKVEKYGGHIATRLDATEPIVRVDDIHFTNLISNLLDNAVKYRREDVPPELCVATSDLPGHRLEITVSDNGIGIRREDQKRIFEKFFRVNTGNRHDVRGFGLGLAYVKKMIVAFGGSISVESTPGVGTTFRIVLPLAEDVPDTSENNQ